MYKPTAILWQPLLPKFFKITVLGSALAALGLTGCSSSQSATQGSKSKLVGSGYLDANSLDSLEDLLSATDMRAVEGDRLLILKHGDVWKRMTVGFKMDQTHWDSRIEAQRGWFISRQPYLDRLSARASRYLYHTVKEAERRGLPTELALLPIIESSYDPAATSSAAAAGMWQFIPSTGRIYGLKQTGLYDGRRDVVESTRAAYEFLGGLYNQFGSWELALAAYNAGPGRIQQAINRNKAAGLPTDYWSLKLPQETMNYVPRFLAVAQIIKNPGAYGVSLPPIANRPHFREVPVGPVSLNEIASITGLSRAELYQLNPGHRGDLIDSESPMRIIIPADLSPSIDARLKKLSSSSGGLWASTAKTFTPEKSNPPELNTQVMNPVKTAPPVLTTTTTKTTQPAATATVKAVNPVTTTTASKARISTPQGSAALASFASNSDIPSAPRIPVAVTQVANVKPVTVEPPLSSTEREQILAAVKAEGENKTVEEVLQPVASKAEQDKVVAELKALAPQGTEITDPFDGKIKLTAIQTSQSVAEQQGKELTKGFSYPKGVAENTKADSDEAKRNQGKNYVKTDSEVVVTAPKGKRSTYTVLPGDTLAVIAMKNGLNWRDVAKWNQIDPNSPLYVGTSIYLYDAKPQSTETSASTKSKIQSESYVVQANDNLTGVASQFGMSVKQLADYNNLSVSSGLRVGQKLSLKETAQSNSDTAETRTSNSKSPAKVKTKSYVVKRGEYLKLIAERYALSNQELADLTKGLTAGSSLMVGQKINVPLQEAETKVEAKQEEKATAIKVETAVEPSYKTESYRVQRGDTLSSIAAQSKISLTELAQLNKLSNTQGLQVGQTLKIPADSTVPESYTVQSGDSLSAISAKYNLGMDYIANINGINRNTGLRVGQRLKLSSEEPALAKVEAKIEKVSFEKQNDIHVVKSGETLSSIAKKYHLQLDYLAALNGLTRNSTVRIGQRLKIEGDLPKLEAKVDEPVAKAVKSSKNTDAYTVKPGESLNAIASRAGISVAELASLNDLNARAGLR
ncbi:MAG: LysM peptidoglycan-binding domain-containing protein, partial [Acinetobacter sp.]